MIVMYTGTPGSGKSLHAASDIRYALTKPRGDDQPVIANFVVNTSHVTRPNAFHYMGNEELTPGWLVDFADDFWTHVERGLVSAYRMSEAAWSDLPLPGVPVYITIIWNPPPQKPSYRLHPWPCQPQPRR